MTSHKTRCCPSCGGTQRPGRTTFVVDFGSLFFAVRDVPALVCDQCGAEWLSPDTVRELTRLAHEARDKPTQVAILSAAEMAV